MYIVLMIKYWLIILLIQNGEVVERHEIRYKNEVACYLAMEQFPMKPGLVLQAQCVERNVERAYR